MSHKNKHDPAVPTAGTKPEPNGETTATPTADSTTPPTPEPAAPKPPPTTKIIKLTEAEHAQLKAEAAKAAENWDKLLRSAADFDNYRKRVTREKEETVRSAREAIITSLLPALDNLERALDHSPAGTPLHEGLLQVQKQFERALADFGLTELITKPGDIFNPSQHEAISHVESNDHPDGAILQQIQSGYKLADKLIRPARVVVSKGKPPVEGEAPAEPQPAEPQPEDKKPSWFKSPFAK